MLPSQSHVPSAIPAPPQTPHSSINKQLSLSVFASALKLHAVTSVHPKTSGTYSAEVNVSPVLLVDSPVSLRHCMFQLPSRKPPSAPSSTVNCANNTLPSSPAIAPGFEPGVTYQLPPVSPSMVNPFPALKAENASDKPMELTGPSSVVSDPMVNQLS